MKKLYQLRYNFLCVSVQTRQKLYQLTGLLKIFDLMAQLRSVPKLLWHIFTPIKEFYGTNTHAHTNTFKTPNKQYFGFAIYLKTKNINSLTLGNSLLVFYQSPVPEAPAFCSNKRIWCTPSFVRARSNVRFSAWLAKDDILISVISKPVEFLQPLILKNEIAFLSGVVLQSSSESLSLWCFRFELPINHAFSDMLIDWQTWLISRDLIGSRNHSPPMETPVRLLLEISKSRHRSE